MNNDTEHSIVNDRPDEGQVSLSEVLGGLSYGLDLTEGQRPGHSVRSCLIGMRLAEVIGLNEQDRSALFYALLMKDLGCSSNAARFAALFGNNDHDIKNDLKHIDWSRALESFRFVLRNAAPGQFLLRRVWRVLAIFSRGPEGARAVVRTRCERGAEIARLIGLEEATASAIRALDEHWDGRGQPYALRGENIPLFARILGLAQTFEVFLTDYGVGPAHDMAATRRGKWFDPALVDALFSIGTEAAFWNEVTSDSGLQTIKALEPPDRRLTADEDYLNRIAEAFAGVIDAKSPWTYQHSNNVAKLSVAIGRQLDFPEHELRHLRRAGLLHDLGKLAVSNLILDKPGQLTEHEFAIIRRHPEHTGQILKNVSAFQQLAEAASSHHERLDGSGYHRGKSASELTAVVRVLCVADICDALWSSRPYRAGLPVERVVEVMKREAGKGIDMECFEALRVVLLDTSTMERADTPAAANVPALAEDYHQAA